MSNLLNNKNFNINFFLKFSKYTKLIIKKYLKRHFYLNNLNKRFFLYVYTKIKKLNMISLNFKNLYIT